MRKATLDEDALLVLIIWAVVVISAVVSHYVSNNEWRVDAIAHGAAHYDSKGRFEWLTH